MKTVLKMTAIILLLMCATVMSEEQAVFDLKIFDLISDDGPITRTQCKVTFPEGSSQHTIIWEFEGEQLAVNGTIDRDGIWTADTSNRTYVQYNELISEQWKRSSFLSIHGAVINDEREGNYQCLAEYFIGNTHYENEKTIFVSISYYLPPSDYPKCSASQSDIDDGDDITFSCDAGDSYPPMNLKLELVGPGGTKTDLGNLPEITTMVTLNNNNSCFMCLMTSDDYTSVQRRCSFGPITVLPRSSTPSMSTQDPSTNSKPKTLSESSQVASTRSSSTTKPKTSSATFQSTYPKASPISSQVPHMEYYSTASPHNTATKSNTATQLSSPIIISSIVGGVVMIIILLIIIICLVIRMSKAFTKPSTDKEHPMDNMQSAEKAAQDPVSTKNQDDSMQVYSEVDKDTPNPKTTSKASNHTNEPQDKSDQETNEEIPVYAISTMEGAADHTTGDKMTNDMPIYSQVNKGSDMVENMIYEPAGPM